MTKRGIIRPWILILLINVLGYGLLALNSSSVGNDIIKTGAYVTVSLMVAYFVVNKISGITDNYIFLIVSMLFSVGEIMLCRLDYDFARKQMFWLLISLVVFLVVYILFKKLEIWQKLGYAYYITAVALFLLTLILGTAQGGSKNWIVIAGYTFQPSEIIKLLVVLFLADRYAHPERYRFKNLNEDVTVSVLICVFLGFFVLQREWGTAVLVALLHLFMMYIFGARIKVILMNLLFAIAGGGLGALFVSHIKVRISVWLDPWSQVMDKAYQITQSLFAITGGGLFGTGLAQGSPWYIPEVHSDFIFAAICEEFGILGGVGVVLLYLLLVYRGIRIAMCIDNVFYRCVATGISVMLGLQIFIILGGVIKLIPLTGITLPFISYGGSSLLSCFVSIAVLEACATKKANGEMEAIDIEEE